MKNKYFKKSTLILLFVAVFCFALFSVSCKQKVVERSDGTPTSAVTQTLVPTQKPRTTMTDIQDKGYMVVACEATEPPYIYTKKDGMDYIVTGPEYDLAMAIAEDLGVELVIKSVKQSDILVGVETGLYDFGFTINSLSVAESQVITLSDTYFLEEYPVVILKENEGKHEDFSDFKDLDIGVIGRYKEYYIIKEVAHKYAKIRVYGNESMLVEKVLSGDYAAACLKAYKARYYVDKYADKLTYMDYVIVPDDQEGRNISLSKEKQDFVTYINDFIKKKMDEEFLLTKLGVSVTDYSINKFEIDNACTEYVGVLYGK